MIALGLLFVYIVGTILTARRLVWKTMCRNELSTFCDIDLEPRLYSKKDYKKMASQKYRYRYISDEQIPDSDFKNVVWFSLMWPGYLTGVSVRAMVMNGHRKTPGQREKELKEREKQMAELEAQRDKEWKDRLKEAGIDG